MKEVMIKFKMPYNKKVSIQSKIIKASTFLIKTNKVQNLLKEAPLICSNLVKDNISKTLDLMMISDRVLSFCEKYYIRNLFDIYNANKYII